MKARVMAHMVDLPIDARLSGKRRSGTIPHGLCKPKLADLTHCSCGREKVEWRENCTECSRKKLQYYQRKRALEKLSRKNRAEKEVSA